MDSNNVDHLKDLISPDDFDHLLKQIRSRPRRKYTQEEFDEARRHLSLMHDRVFLGTLANNKNNWIITDIVNALRKIHRLKKIPPIEQTKVQDVSLYDVFMRGMIADLLGMAPQINITMEVQKLRQKGFAIRGTIASGNAMRIRFDAGSEFIDAPDVIGVNILGFRQPELRKNKMFCSRIVRSEYDTKLPFLADKYSDYYVELPKMDNYTKEQLAPQYHDIWDLCCIFRATVSEYEEVIRMYGITNASALELSNEVRKTVAPNEFIEGTLLRKDDWEEFKAQCEQLRADYLRKVKSIEERIAKADMKAAQADMKAAKEAREAKEASERMIIAVLRESPTPSVIEAIRQSTGISEVRLAELREKANKPD